MAPVLVQACLNGSRRREDHAAVPISFPEVALDAYQAVAAGAGALHIHPRQADGSETLEPGACALTIAAVRRTCPRTALGITTAAWIEPDQERRRWFVERWEILPDFASVNLNEAGWSDVAEALIGRGIGVEAGVASTDDAARLGDSAVGGKVLRVLVEVSPSQPEEAVAEAAAIDRALDEGDVTAPRLHHGEGRATWAVLRAAVALGHDIRVGLEDTLVLPDGRAARDNAELVRAAVRLAGGEAA